MAQCIAEKDYFPIITPQTAALSDMMDIDELLPIELDEVEEHEDDFYYQQQPQSQNATRKSVSFSAMDQYAMIESSEDWTEDERNASWYGRSELDACKSKARKLCQQHYKKNPTNANANASTTSSIPSDESVRGMEVYFPSRQRAHAKFVFHVLHAYHVQCVGNPDYVGQLCAKWSAKASERALVNGIQDFYEAYLPHMIQQTTEMPPTTPVPLIRHRSSASPPERRS
jgi:hypothetical protein